MKPQDLFNKGLTRTAHLIEDLHYIGESLPSPSLAMDTLSSGTPASHGVSAIPAREDHIHALDISDLETAIDDLITAGTTTLVNEEEVINLINIHGGSGSGGGGPNDFTWSYDDLIVDPTTESFSDKWYPPGAATITKFYGVCTGVSAAGTYIFKLYKNGIEIDSISLLAGEVVISSVLSEAIASTQYWQVSVQKSGSFTGDLEGLLLGVVYEYA